MARYIGPKAKLSRREGTDLFLKSARRSLASKCKLDVKPGQHGRTTGARRSDFGIQLREKQKVKAIYGILEKHLRRYFKAAARRRGNKGELLLKLLESRLDNVVYRSGFASTRAHARQMISHGWILVNGRKLDVPSALVSSGDLVSVSPGHRSHAMVQECLNLAEQYGFPDWIAVDKSKAEANFKRPPDRVEIAADINESLIVELYSR